MREEHGKRARQTALLMETERVLRTHAPTAFDSTVDAWPECIEYVRVSEDAEAWKAGYASVDDFYRAHEVRHPDVRVYGEARRELESRDVMTPGLPERPSQTLDRLRRQSGA